MLSRQQQEVEQACLSATVKVAEEAEHASSLIKLKEDEQNQVEDEIENQTRMLETLRSNLSQLHNITKEDFDVSAVSVG